MNKISALTTPVEFDSGDFLSVLSLSAGTAIARQNKFGELIGNDNWNVDIRERTITFGNRVFEIGIIGSESEYSNTWLWGWAHTESGLPDNNVRNMTMLPDGLMCIQTSSMLNLYDGASCRSYKYNAIEIPYTEYSIA